MLNTIMGLTWSKFSQPLSPCQGWRHLPMSGYKRLRRCATWACGSPKTQEYRSPLSPYSSLLTPALCMLALSLHSWRWRDWFMNKDPSFPPFALWIKPFLLPHTHFLVVFLEGEDTYPSVLSDEDASLSEPSDEDTSLSGPSDGDASPTWISPWKCHRFIDCFTLVITMWIFKRYCLENVQSQTPK